jgi:hypothetical protein
MKKMMLGMAVVVAVGSGWACLRKAPQSESRVEDAPAVATTGPVREITFEPDVIVAYQADVDGQ